MKTIKFIATAVVCMLSLTANAQSTMRIEFEGGKQVDYPVSSITSIKWFTNETSPTTPDISPSGVQAVDLGLSVKWANMNIGATSMEDYGDYFAWGETVGYNGGKNTFNTSTYKYYMSTTTKDKDGFDVITKGYTKYVTKSNASSFGYNGFYDDKTILDPEDDAAIANWGGSWRMPTKAEQSELHTQCTWQWTSMNGVRGYKVIGPNGNFIFLPAAGRRSGSSLLGAGSDGFYWSPSLSTSDPGYAYSLRFDSGGVHRDYYYYDRYDGRSVRAVCP